MENLMPGYIRRILKKLNTAGYEAYAVGGCVRDTVMGRKPHDWDITTSAGCEAVQRLFEHTAPTGIKYGTVTVLCPEGEAQVTTFRADGKYREGRHPESVEFLQSLSGDLERRDFTVNAMAMDLSGEITDLFGGMQDIERGIIRCVGEPERRFCEDALRMMRGVRFSAQLGFEIEQETFGAMRRCAGLVSCLSGERMREEIEKIIMSGRPEMLETAAETGLLKYHFPCSCFVNINRISSLPEKKDVRWTAICASAGIKEVPEKLRIDRKTAEAVSKSAEILNEPMDTDGDLRYLLTVYGSETLLCAAAAAYILDNGKYGMLIRAAEELTPVRLAVNGTDLANAGITRGPAMGETLVRLLRYVCDRPDKNEKDYLLRMAVEELKEDRI